MTTRAFIPITGTTNFGHISPDVHALEPLFRELIGVHGLPTVVDELVGASGGVHRTIDALSNLVGWSDLVVAVAAVRPPPVTIDLVEGDS